MKISKKTVLVSSMAIILVSLFLLQGCGPGCGKDIDGVEVGAIEKLTVATDPAFPPFETIYDETGEIIGFDIELMMIIAETGEFDVEFIGVISEDLLLGLDFENYDAVISAIAVTDKLGERYDFSDPYYGVRLALLVKEETAEGVKDIDGLKGRRVGAEAPSSAFEFLEDYGKVEVVPFDNIPDAVDALLGGDISGVVCEHPVAFEFALVDEATKDSLSVIDDDLTGGAVESYAIVVKKENEKTLAVINDALNQVLKGDTIEKLEVKWYLAP